MLLKKITDFLVEDTANIKAKEALPWEIIHINNGFKCEHKSGLYEDVYFEADEINAENAFSDRSPMTPLSLFGHLKSKTPYTKGFIYKSWNIIEKSNRGFLIKLRTNDSNLGIQKNNDVSYLERYKTNESLSCCNINDFILYLERGTDNAYY